MKNLIVIALPALVLSSCATAGSQCISPSEAGGQPINYGSAEAKATLLTIPRITYGPDVRENSLKIISEVNAAIDKYNMTPEGETVFIRKRLEAHKSLLNIEAAKVDIQRLTKLDRLKKNEAPFLLAELENLTSRPKNNYDEAARTLTIAPSLMIEAALVRGISGHCRMGYDVSENGNTENIRVGYCTDEVFRQSSIDSIATWKYIPAKREGKNVTHKNITSYVRYNIQDSCGNLLPE